MRGLDVFRAKRKSSTPEGEVKKAICDYLQLLKNQKHLDFWICSTTGTYDVKRGIFRKKKSKYERTGLADISGIIRGGRRLEIEVKRPLPKTPAIKQCSDEQVKFLSGINAKGGLAFAASSVMEVRQMMEEHVLGIGPQEGIL